MHPHVAVRGVRGGLRRRLRLLGRRRRRRRGRRRGRARVLQAGGRQDSRVPGCAPGRAGDVPGADYCYDVSLSGVPTGEPVTYSPTTEAPQGTTGTEPPTAPGTTSSPTPAGAYFIRSQARGVPPRSSSSSSRSLLEGCADYNRGKVSITWGSSANPEQSRALQGSSSSPIHAP